MERRLRSARTGMEGSWSGSMVDEAEEGIMQPTGVPPSLQRLYAIKYDPDADFFCGDAPSGEQVLMGLGGDDLVLVSFKPDGTFIGCYRKRVNLTIPGHLTAGERRYEEITQLIKAMGSWQSELGLTPADISIRHFFIPEMDIG